MDYQISKLYPRFGSKFKLSIAIAVFLVGLLYLSIWPFSLTNTPIFSFQTKQFQSQLPNPSDELEEALSKVSTTEKIVIVAVINKAYSEILDIFLESFWLGEGTRPLRDHLLMVAVDQTAYDRCQYLKLNCYRLETDGQDFAGEKFYMSQDFIRMMWRRTLFLLEVLKRGYNFIFTDTDVVWLRNPFERLSKNETEDLQISADIFFGNPWDKTHLINTGFYYIRSNNKTIALFEKWYSMKDNSTGKKEQDVLMGLMRSDTIQELGLRVRVLDTLYFSGFCQDSKDFRAVTTVHANCCRSIAAKVADLRAVLQDWNNFKSFTFNSSAFRWSGHWECGNSWNVSNNETKV